MANITRRSNEEFRHGERQHELQQKQTKRTDKEYRERERLIKETERSNPKFRDAERQQQAQQKRSNRSNEQYKEQETRRGQILKSKCRLNPLFKQMERVYKAEKRHKMTLVQRQNVYVKETQRRAMKRKELDKGQQDHEQTTQSTHSINLKDSLASFSDIISKSCTYVCTCCMQTWFHQSVINAHELKKRTQIPCQDQVRSDRLNLIKKTA